MAATRLDHHVAVFLEDDVVVAVIIEDGGGAELGGCAAGLGYCFRLHQVNLKMELKGDAVIGALLHRKLSGLVGALSNQPQRSKG